MLHAATQPERVAALILCAPLIRGSVSIEVSISNKVLRAPASVRTEARQIFQSSLSRSEQFDRLLHLMDQSTRYSFQFYEPASQQIMDRLQANLASELGKPLMHSSLLTGLLRSGLDRFDAYPLLPQLTMPQAVLVSPFDSEISAEDAMRYAASAPNAELKLFHQSGHHPYLEEPAVCAIYTNDFLSSQGL